MVWRAKLSGARKHWARYATPLPRKSGSGLSHMDGGMVTLPRGGASLEKKRESDADLWQQHWPTLSCRSQIREQKTGCRMSTCRTYGELGYGEQQKLPTQEQKRQRRPWLIESSKIQIALQRKKQCWDKRIFLWMSTSCTSTNSQHGKDTSMSLSKQSNEPYLCSQLETPQGQRSCFLELYDYSGRERQKQ